MPAGCTIAAKQEWAQARLIAESFREHHPDLPFFVLLADEPEGVFDPGAEPFEVVRLSDLGVPREMIFRYPRLWLSYALTPSLIAHVLGRGFDEVVFIKQESLVTGRLESMLAALGRSEVVITPHRLEPGGEGELPFLLAGVYNGGIVGVADRGDGPGFLRWWQDRCERHCLLAVEGGMHYEQRWLDLAPALFDGVELLRDPGVQRRPLERGPARRDIEHASLVRFSGFDEREPERVTKYYDRRVSELGPAEPVWRLYAERLLAAGMETTRGWSYAYEEFGDGVKVPDMARAIYRDQERRLAVRRPVRGAGSSRGCASRWTTARPP